MGKGFSEPQVSVTDVYTFSGSLRSSFLVVEHLYQARPIKGHGHLLLTFQSPQLL